MIEEEHTTQPHDDTKQPQNIGTKIDRIYELREKKKKLEEDIRTLGKETEELVEQVMDGLHQLELDQGRGVLAKATLTEEEVPDVKDWDAVYEFIKENDAFYLLQRKVNSRPFRELKESGTIVPGIETFKKKSLSIRKR